MAPSEWLLAWRGVHWACLGAAGVCSLFLLLHSAAFHRVKRRKADLLLSGIAMADALFVSMEALKQLLHASYLARYYREDDHPHPSTEDFVLTLLGRFGFFMPLYWIANLSLLMRLGNLEALHIKRSFLLSSLASIVYGCMYAVLPSLSDDEVGTAYTVTAVLLLLIQVTPLLLIMNNLRAVRKSRLNSSPQGRNVIRRLTGYCVCAAVFTLPYALVLISSRRLVGVGAVAETCNYFVPIANALLFGTSLSCYCCCSTAKEVEEKREDDTPSSSIDISAGVLTDGSGTPGSTGYTGLTKGGVLGFRDGLLAEGPIAEMETDGLAVKIGERSSAEVYRAQWLGITVALKCLRFHAGATGSSEADLYMTHLAELRTEFLDEAVLAAQLRHPNITLFIKMGTNKGSLCLVKYVAMA